MPLVYKLLALPEASQATARPLNDDVLQVAEADELPGVPVVPVAILPVAGAASAVIFAPADAALAAEARARNGPREFDTI